MIEEITDIPDIIGDVHVAVKAACRTGDALVDGELDHLLSKHGKGIRAHFMCMVAGLAGGSWNDIRTLATAIETVHLSSLLHDDVIDGAELRRGLRTLNSRHSGTVSVLVGDLLFLSSISLADVEGDRRAVTIILSAVRQMVGGELRGELSIPEDEVACINIAAAKTASLFAAGGELAVLVSGGGQDECAWGREMGEKVGIAFQLIDDALDYSGNDESMGKRSLMDLRTGTITLPAMYALRDIPIEQRAGFLKRKDDLRDLVESRGGIAYTLARADEYIAAARTVAGRFTGGRTIEDAERFFRSVRQRRG